MDKWFGYWWLGFLYHGIALGQQCTVEDVEKQISHVYKIIEFPLDQKNSQLMAIVDTIAPTYSLAKLTNNHTVYVAYLSSNYSSVKSNNILTPGMSLKQANEAYHKAIANDTVFNRHFLTMSSYYLQAQGITIKGFTPPIKPVLTMPALMQIATRFFERLGVAPNQHIVWHLNQKAIAEANYDSPTQNQPLIEAFCSEAVMNWSFTKEWHSLQYDQEFYAEVKSLMERTAQLTSADDQRQVVRPAMRQLMSRSKVLEKVLLAEYQRSQNWLGFTLIY